MYFGVTFHYVQPVDRTRVNDEGYIREKLYNISKNNRAKFYDNHT